MDCTTMKDLLTEAAEGEPAERDRPRLEEHLRTCESCRRELAALRRAAGALRAAIPELAPPGAHLTAERRARLMDAHVRSTKIFRLITYRQFIAAAASLAIVVSTATITWNLGKLRAPAPAETDVVSASYASSYRPVVVTATDGGGTAGPVRSMPVSRTQRPRAQSGDRFATLVSSSSAGVAVPVDHVLYDPAESSRWW